MPGLALAELDEGQLDAPPGLQFVRHGGVGAAFVLFWLLVSCLRGAASRGPARGGAARRGGCGGVAGGRYLGHLFTWRLLLFGANLRNVGAPRMEPLRGNGFLQARARGWRGADAQRRVPPEGPRGPRAARRGAPKETRRTGGRGYRTGDRRCLGAGRARRAPPTLEVDEPAAAANSRCANPSARAAKQEHAHPRPTVAAPTIQNAPPPQPRKKPGAPNTTDKTHRSARAHLKEKPSPRRL